VQLFVKRAVDPFRCRISEKMSVQAIFQRNDYEEDTVCRDTQLCSD